MRKGLRGFLVPEMWLVSYGSLMDKEKIKGKDYRLVIVKDRKRIFNKVVSRKVWKRYSKGNEIATLNVIKNKKSSFNAIAYKINNKDFRKLKDREKDYHLEKAEVYDYKTNKKLGQYNIFVSSKKIQKIK